MSGTNSYIDKLLMEFVSKRRSEFPQPTIFRSWLNNICWKIPPHIVMKNKTTILESLKLVQEEHQRILSLTDVYMCITPSDHDIREQLIAPIKPDFIDKETTFLSHKFYKKRFKNEVLWNHPVIKYVVRQTVKTLPETFLLGNPFRHYCGYEELDVLTQCVEADIEKNNNFIRNVWFSDLLIHITEDNALDGISDASMGRFLRFVTLYIESQLILSMERTVREILTFFDDFLEAPMMNLTATYAGGTSIIFEPSEENLRQAYRSIITQVMNVAGDLPSLEQFIIPHHNGLKYMKIERHDDFFAKSLEQLDKSLRDKLKPVYEHLKILEDEFSPLFSPECYNELVESQGKDKPFDEYFDRIEHYSVYYKNAQLLPENEYIENFRIKQKDLVDGIKEICKNYIAELMTEIVWKHVLLCTEICNEFEEVKTHALSIPGTTEELIDVGKYMEYCTTHLMENMKTRVYEALHIGCRLMGVGKIQPSHTKLITRTCSWLKDMKPIFEKYSILYEDAKLELEERLQQTTEKLNKELEDFNALLEGLNNMDQIQKIRWYGHYMSRYLRVIEDFDEVVTWINKEEALLKLPPSTYPELDEYKAIIYPFARLVYSEIKWYQKYKIWLDGPFEDIELLTVKKNVDEFYERFSAMQKTYKDKCKQHLNDNYPKRLKGYVDDPDFNMWPTPLKLLHFAIKSIKDFKQHLGLIGIMCNPALTEKHWQEMSDLVGFELTPDCGVSLRKFIGYGLDKYMEQFKIISTEAIQQNKLAQSLTKMQSEWDEVCFRTRPHKDTGLHMIASVDDILELIDDHLVRTLTIRSSSFVKPIERKARDWHTVLEKMSNTISDWEKIQAQWLQLLPIFSLEDLREQMPDATLSKDIYTNTIKRVVKEPRVLIAHEHLLSTMKVFTDKIDLISAWANTYLEKKRLYFPRFYFLSNPELLEVLSETNDPSRVQQYLTKLFEGIASLGFDDSQTIYSMFSAKREEIQFGNVISTTDAKGNVEKWLLQVKEQMTSSLKELIARSFSTCTSEKGDEWVKKWPGQVVLCVSQICWTAELQTYLEQGNLSGLEIYHSHLEKDLNSLLGLVRGELTEQSRVTTEALVILNIHVRDVAADLLSKGVTSENDFEWLAQLRYYWNDGVIARITNAVVAYSYEYLGNSPRLVMTPLTERCYRTIIGAYYLHLNGAPEGPSGAGKTETVKDLAKAIAVLCISLNCSSDVDYKTMAMFFKGLAASGSWACFDEFNRIHEEVLSVIAQQMISIVQAVRNRLEIIVLEGTTLTLNPVCHVCITVNPNTEGRSKLPDNLKVLFRTVAMMVPDYALIAEILLYSFGFKNPKTLSEKIVTTYSVCSELLSSQSHYNYGIRTIRTVLSVAAGLKLKFPEESEDTLVLNSIIGVSLPMFSTHDVPIFEEIVGDLFPGLHLTQYIDTNLTETLKEVCERMNLQSHNLFLTKVKQMYETMMVRHGIMLVGSPFGGKTTVLHVLAEAITLMNERGADEKIMNIKTLNPKSITMSQLFGQFDAVSHEWCNGIVPMIFREFAISDTRDRQLIVFDGPVEDHWIESLDTVLDETKQLCLPSGEVIKLLQDIFVVFEVIDLIQVSPATISRCGIIYLETETIGWRSLVVSWDKHIPTEWKEDKQDRFLQLCDWLIPPSTKFITTHCKKVCDGGVYNTVKSTIQLVDMILKEAFKEKAEQKYISSWVLAAFIMAMVWGAGGALDQVSREKYDVFIKDVLKGNNKNAPIPETIDRIEIPIPSEGILHDYTFQFKGKGQWKYWPETVRGIKTDDPTNSHNVFVTTVEAGKYLNILELHANNKVPFLITGPSGTGKSLCIQHMMTAKLPLNEFIPAFITFTGSTSASLTRELVLSKLSKRKKGVYGPPTSKVCALFVDDVSMPVKEKNGAQPAIELLRQYLDHKHWYDPKNASKIILEDLLIFAAMVSPGNSSQTICARFLRHFSLYSISEFSGDSITKIFTTTLFSGLRSNGFSTDVMAIVQNVVSATLNFYTSAIKDLLPTPGKPHYRFNLKDFYRVINGYINLKKESTDNKRIFVRLWIHEVMRAFYDKIIDEADREWAFDKMNIIVTECFEEEFDKMLNKLEQDKESTVVSQKGLRNLIFTFTFDKDGEKKYEEIQSIEVFHQFVMGHLEDYNSTHQVQLNIVLFRYALEHLSRICRILSAPGGSGLLVGVGGSGRQSLTRLAAALSGQNIYQPEKTKTYGLNEWRNFLKNIMKETGVENKPTIILLDEGQLSGDHFLQDIVSFLNSGEIPNVFGIDETYAVLEALRLDAQKGDRNLDISPHLVFSYFTNRCKRNLHIIICFSPIGSAFKNNLQHYPSLVKCCTIDWFELTWNVEIDGKTFKIKGWPEDALEKVAQQYLSPLSICQSIKDSAVNVCQYFHATASCLSERFYNETGLKTYVTSKSFLHLIEVFVDLVIVKQEEITNSNTRYVGGLDKLGVAAQQVSVMEEHLEALRPKLALAIEETVRMLKVIEEEKAEVEKQAQLVMEQEEVASSHAQNADKLKAECDSELAHAVPIVEDAVAALSTLKPADIVTVKAMKNPPEFIKVVMSAVCVMKGVKPEKVSDPSNPGRKVLDYWGPSKRLLNDMSFLQQLKEFDKDNISPQVMAVIRKQYLPHKDFQPSVVGKASSAAEGLCKWIIALDMYDVVVKDLAPKKAKHASAVKEFTEAMAKLDAKQSVLKSMEEKLELLNTGLQEAHEYREKLQGEVESCVLKLEKARSIIESLEGEKEIWSQRVNDLKFFYDSIPGDMLLSCGIISYLAPYTSSYRQELIEDWIELCIKLEIPVTNKYSLTEVLGSELKIQTWYTFGLPRSVFTTDNAIIQDNSKRWSLLIDPQGLANKWIKIMEKRNDLEVITLPDDDYIKKVKVCVQLGKALLLEHIGEDFEPFLEPILLKKTYEQGNTTYISLGSNTIEYNKQFRLYITSKSHKPHYLPEVVNKVTIINFSLNKDDLKDKLLEIAIAKERPDLEKKRQTHLAQNTSDNKALIEIEERILTTLLTVPGNILEDEAAVNILDSSKALSKEILSKQEVCKETQEMFKFYRSSYNNFATYSARLYYTTTDLAKLDPMYQYSLEWFIGIFMDSFKIARKCANTEKRIEYMIETLNYNLFLNVCRSLFHKDKILYAFILYTVFMMSQNRLEQFEIEFLVTGGILDVDVKPNPASDWLNDKVWYELCRADDLKPFEGIIQDFENQINEWKTFYDLQTPTLDDLPPPWNSKITKFQMLIIARILRPDRLTPLILHLIKEELGPKFTQPPQFDMLKTYEDTICLRPIILILSEGVDPMPKLIKFSRRMKFEKKFRILSLGQGQGQLAQALVKEAQSEGTWVCLENCHLATSWMPMLEKICDNIDRTNTAINFRLWLTTCSTDQFPVPILQNGVKATMEPPTGLHQILLQTYTSDPLCDRRFFESCFGKENIFTKLLFGVTFFHAVVLERRKYGPIGWSIPYGFDESDYLISIQQLKKYILEYESIPFEAVSYLIRECYYGGRVTDEWDRRTLHTFLEDCFNHQIVFNRNYTLVEGDGQFKVPIKYGYRNFLNLIERIPIVTSPEVFGLHINAELTFNRNSSSTFLDNLLKVQEANVDNGNETDKVNSIAQDILSRLPPLYDLNLAMELYPHKYMEPMNTVLLHELERLNRLLSTVKNSLEEIKSSVKNTNGFSAELESLYNSLINGHTPVAWIKVSYPSLKQLGSYINDFLERLTEFQNWLESGEPISFWISGFFFAQSFLTGIIQTHARRHGISLEQLTYDFEITSFDKANNKPETGVYVFGLFLEGSRWDRTSCCLNEQIPKVLYDVLPSIWIIPIRKVDFEVRDRYNCPLYQTTERKGVISITGHSTNYVLSIPLDTKKPVRHWVKRGVASLCQLND